MIRSGTEECRPYVLRYINNLSGVDIGYGGQSISRRAINIDLPKPYTRVGNDPQHLSGDAQTLPWFKDNSLDYVYSLHLLEDFEDPVSVLYEWARVIKPGGLCILYLPVEDKYRQWCKTNRKHRNTNHRVFMSPEYIQSIMPRTIFDIEECVEMGLFSFLTIARKKK